ncbi:hypothetical protein ACHAXT_005316 [Thalassiosira profunda]
MVEVSPGDAVLTQFGTGVVVRCLDDAHSTRQDAEGPGAAWAVVMLERRPGQSVASCATATMRVDCIEKKLVAAPGMTVHATPSAAEGSNVGDEEEETREKTRYLIERYVPSEDVYVASSVDGDDGAGGGLAKSLAVISSPSKDGGGCKSAKQQYELRPDQIVPSSSSAKFYPILEDLIERGEAAWNMAAEKSKEHSPELAENVSNVAEKLSSAVTINSPGRKDVSVAAFISDASKNSGQTINAKLADASVDGENGDVANITAKQALDTATDKATAVAGAATEGLSMPQTEEIKSIYKMLRDDDLTELFLKGKERLKELVEVEVPARTKNALGAMGIELEEETIEDGKQSMQGSIAMLRKEALASLDQILKMEVSEDGKIVLQSVGGDATSIQIDTKGIVDPSLLPSNAVELTQQAQLQFSSMFDHLSTVATSDPQLQQIFSGISDRTKQWQEMTGRILQTKTASLFMEGSQRLHARAAEMLNLAPSQLSDAFGGGGSNGDLTQAFTEGDVAMAKLKSMEMGDAIRQRLFAAIELRSESSGGLDAIIAGSLTAIQRSGDEYGAKAAGLLGKQGLEDLSLSSIVGSAGAAAGNADGVSEDAVQRVISSLQQSATSSMSDTKETLIALLSHQSGYRDAVLLRLEQVFLDLESTLGQDMSAEEIAKLASGEGGTLALFQPVAAKAAKEIETQMDLAEEKMKESKHWDPRIEDVMQTVRKMMRGELSMSDVIDMAAGYLDDEEVVAKSGGLIVKAEGLLDDFEAASARLGDAGKASGEAGAGIMDAVAKAGITKDTVMKGVEGLNVNKLLDDTQNAMTDEVARRELISSAGDTALDFLLKVLPEMPVPPFDGVREGLVYHLSNLSMAGFNVKKEDIYIEIAGIHAAAQDPSAPQPPRTGSVKASELLIIDIKNISATLNDAIWSFEQTYMPYLKGSGKANTRLWDGAIRLKFELRRRQTEDSKWEPVLCLNDRTCSIGGVELVIQGESRIAWVANKLASYLKNPLRDYVVKVIIEVLTNNSGWLLDTLNSNLSPYWDFVMRTADLELDKLPKLRKHHVTKAVPDEAEDEVELVWRERVPLGLNILTNDASGYLKIIDLPRGTQARQVAQASQLDPDIFKGSTIVSVNGRRYGPDNQVDLFAALKDPARPKSILFKLASQDDAKRMDEIAKKGKGRAKTKGPEEESEKEGAELVTVVDIVDGGDIGIKFASHDNFALAVSDFIRDGSGQPLSAERTGKIVAGDLLSHIDGTLVLGEKGEGKRKALELLEKEGSNRPLSLGFVKPYLHSITLEKGAAEDIGSFGGPDELVLKEIKSESSNNENKIVLTDYSLAEGAAETGGVFIGDNLAFINGIPVGAGCRLLNDGVPSPKLDAVMEMLKTLEPLALTFARAQANKKTSTVKSYLTASPLSLDIEAAYTFSIPVPDHSYLGCKFVTGMNGSDFVVKKIGGVQGQFQRQMRASKQPFTGCKLESVDGEVVPSYANSQLIVNAMKRRWTSNGRVELTFCNERQRDALHKLESLEE